jgi:two-component system response regulator HydG
METRKNFSEITEEAQEKLLFYDWPGNVRELANVIERAIVLGPGPNIALEDLPGIFAIFKTETALDNVSYYGAVNAARRDVVLKALNQVQGNRAAAARLLGLNAKYFLRLIKSLGIE